MNNYLPREYKMTYGPMFVDANGLAWIATRDGIYTTNGMSVSKVSNNSGNWFISGIATMTVSGIPTLFYTTNTTVNNLFSYPIANLTGSDIAGGSIVSTTAFGTLCMTTDGSKLYYIDTMNTLFSHTSLANGEENLGSLTLSSPPTSMCYMNGLYVNTSDNIYSIDTSGTAVLIVTSSPGHVAVDSFGNIFGAASTINGNTASLFEYNVSFDSANPQWNQVGTAQIESVGISSSNVGYGIDVTGNVYTITTSESQLASVTLTGAAIPQSLPPSLIISKNAWASVTNVVLAIDTTLNQSYVFEDISSAYHIDVVSGVLSFTDPSGTTVLQVGSKITLRDGVTTHIFTVADLNLTLTNLITSRFDPTATNPAITLFKGSSSAFASDISAATLAGIPNEAILLEAVIQAHVGNDTGIYSILPDFYSGTTVSIASTDISGFYALLEQKGSTLSTAQKAKGMDICVPDKTTNTIAISTSSANNVMLPIDLNRQLTYPLSLSPGNFSGYSITVDASKNQLFKKDGATVSTINYGDLSGSLVFTEGSDTFIIDVLHYDLVGSFDPITPPTTQAPTTTTTTQAPTTQAPTTTTTTITIGGTPSVPYTVTLGDGYVITVTNISTNSLTVSFPDTTHAKPTLLLGGTIIQSTGSNPYTFVGLNANTEYSISTAFGHPSDPSYTTATIKTLATSAPPICFFGDAPVKTPNGYRRMDSLKVGDRVSTPTGTAVIRHIHCQDYAAGPSANPYVIPKGRFGATENLLISPRHKVAVNGRMVEARDLGLAQQKETGTLTYYNLGLDRWANMIVAGVLVESLAPIARMTISRAEFNQILAAKYGGRMTPEIAAACHFDGDRVSIPVRR